MGSWLEICKEHFFKLIFLLCVAHLSGCAGFRLNQPLAATSLGPIVELPADSQSYRLVISVHDQRMTLLKGQTPVARYLISTAKNGIGETVDSGRTPRGRHVIAEKIGEGIPIGTVFEDLQPGNELIAVNTPGRWPVVTRILRLRGVEDKNQNTFERLIYLRGSPVESLLGTPASGGCIRMRSEEIVDLFDRVDIGTEISVFEEPMAVALGLVALSDARLAALEKAGGEGELNALGQLCYGHVYGARGIPMDDRAAVKWCLLAADKSDPNAITLLGEINERGKGIVVNFEAARRLYERAAKLGHPYAKFKLAQMYKAGIGGVADEALAAQYLALSARQGYARAIKLMQVKAN